MRLSGLPPSDDNDLSPDTGMEVLKGGTEGCVCQMILEAPLALLAVALLASAAACESPSPALDAVCVPTRPNREQPPTKMLGGSGMHGNGKLWVQLPLRGDGKLPVLPRSDGSLAVKLPWWRGVHGRLTVEGGKLDGSGERVQALVPGGYGDTGFQSTAVIFPSPGCWEITGKAGHSSLTFVVDILPCTTDNCWN